MAVAVAPVSLMPCSTLAKTGRPRCSWPAFLGLVPPTTFVPARPRQLLLSLSLRPGGCAVLFAGSRTVLDGLLCVEAAVVLAPRSLRLLLLLPARAGVRCTHVPCLPVKPWNSTLVSPLMRRFLMVSAYCDEPVAYDRVAALVSAERMGCLMACMV